MPAHSILFVCLGNICRSPLAEGVFRHHADRLQGPDDFEIDSAGTGGWHVGERADPRSIEVAQAHGVELTSRARKLVGKDLRRFQWVIAMDNQNLRDVQALADRVGARPRIHLMRDFEPGAEGRDVPDPYYGGEDGFREVYRMIDDACRGLLEAVTAG